MSKLLLKQILSGHPQPIQPISAHKQRIKNPFLQSSDLSQANIDEYGMNRPLHHPMFVGYRDNKPIYAGSRLFVLY